jgi:hypothetical protein
VGEFRHFENVGTRMDTLNYSLGDITENLKKLTRRSLEADTDVERIIGVVKEQQVSPQGALRIRGYKLSVGGALPSHR